LLDVLCVVRDSIFRILKHRQIALDESQLARIYACDDLAMLKRWHLGAIGVRDDDALLDWALRGCDCSPHRPTRPAVPGVVMPGRVSPSPPMARPADAPGAYQWKI
jgi:hypothetical protein